VEQGAASFEHGIPAALLAPGQGLHLGRFRFHGGASGSVAYDDNIRGGSADRQSDVIYTFSPYGSVSTEGPNSRTLFVSYRPSFLFYQDETELNSVNHFANVDLRWPLNRLTLGLAESISVASSVVRDVGERTMQRNYATQFSADYELGNRTSLHGSVGYDVLDYDKPLFDTHQWTEQLFLDYNFSPTITAGAGVSLAQIQSEESPSQTSESPGVRINYQPLPRLNLGASFGLEFRQYDSDHAGTTEPVYRISGSYQLRRSTSASVEAHRSEQVSGSIAGANFIESGFSAGLTQVFLERFVGTLGGGYTQSDYHATESGVRTQRSDSYYFIRTSVGWSMSDNWGLGLFYERRANDSNSNVSFDQNVAGVQASWAF
jgi:hypothetical protein